MSAAAYQSARGRGVVGALLAAGLMLSGCVGLGQNTTIDGWPIGPLQPCPEPNVPRGDPWPEVWDCELAISQWLEAATAGFDKRDPDHGAIARATLHDEAGLYTRSSILRVVVFAMADGSFHAIGVTHPGVDTEHLMTFDRGP